MSSASEKQKIFIQNLIAERTVNEDYLKGLRTRLPTMTWKEAKTTIDFLLTHPLKPSHPWPVVPPGYYIDEATNSVFHVVYSKDECVKCGHSIEWDEGEHEKWKMAFDAPCLSADDGRHVPKYPRTYAKILKVPASGSNKRAKWTYAPGTIKSLSGKTPLSVSDAAKLSHLHGHCIICGRTLVDKKSVTSGIGPVCKQKVQTAWDRNRSEEPKAATEPEVIEISMGDAVVGLRKPL